MTREEWSAIQQDYLQRQAPLREAWLNGDEEAGEVLAELIEETEAKCLPITGTFTYTQADVEEARKAGFHD